jgi:hypothetical protein
MWPKTPILRLCRVARYAGKRGEGGATGGGEAERFIGGGGEADVESTVLAGELLHDSGFLPDDGGVAVGLHEEDGLGSAGEADVGVVLDTLDGGAVEELEGAGDDGVGDDGGDGLGGVLHACVDGEEGAFGGGFGQEAQEDPGEDTEGSFRADKDFAERITGDVLDAFIADPDDLAIGQDDFEAHDVILGDAILESAQAARVAGDVAADGGDFHGAGIGRVEESDGVGLVEDRLGGDAGLDEDGEVTPVELEDAVEPAEAKDDRTDGGNAASGEAGAAAAGDDGGSGGVGPGEEAGDVGGVAGKDDGERTLRKRCRAIEGVGD